MIWWHLHSKWPSDTCTHATVQLILELFLNARQLVMMVLMLPDVGAGRLVDAEEGRGNDHNIRTQASVFGKCAVTAGCAADAVLVTAAVHDAIACSSRSRSA